MKSTSAVTWMATTMPWLSQTRWTLVEKPPRERSSAWSGGSCICTSARPPSRRGPLAFFFRTGGRPAGPDDRAVDAPQVGVDPAVVVQFIQQRGDDAGPGAVAAPAVEAVVGRLPGAVALGEIAPGGAGMEDPEDAVEDRAMVTERMPQLAMIGAVRQEGLDPSPLLVGEFLATHGGPPFGSTLFLRLTTPTGLPNRA